MKEGSWQGRKGRKGGKKKRRKQFSNGGEKEGIN